MATDQLVPGSVSFTVYWPGSRSLQVILPPLEPTDLHSAVFGNDGPVTHTSKVAFGSGVVPFQSTSLVTTSEPCLRVLVMVGTSVAAVPFAGTVIFAVGL